MNGDELNILLETLKRKKKFRDLDIVKFQGVLESARQEYESFSFDPAPSLAAIKMEGAPSPASPLPVADAARKKIFTMRFAASSLAAGAVAAVIVAAVMFLPVSRQQPDHAICSFAYNDVVLHRGAETLRVNAGTELIRGDRIVTGDRSFADIVVDDTAKIRLRSRSSLSISHIIGHDTGNPLNLDVHIGRGAVLFSFKKLGKGDTATVRTPTSVAGVRGTSFGVEVKDDRSVRYEVLEGKIKVRSRVDVSEKGIGNAQGDIQGRVDRILEQGAVTVTSNQVCTIDRDAVEKLAREIRTEVQRQGTSGVVPKADQLNSVRPRVSSAGDSGTRMLSDLRAISSREIENSGNAAVIELSVTALPDSAEIKVDGDYRGNGNVTIVTTPGEHIIEVSGEGYLSKAIKDRFSPEKNTISVRLDRDSGHFSLHRWAAGASSLMLFAVEPSGLLVNVSRSGKIEAVGKNGILWKRRLSSHLTAVPSWDRERMYCATGDERITALSLADGSSQWSRKIAGILLFGSAIEPDGDSLFAGTSRGYLYRFGRNGREIWRAAFDGGIFSSPFVSGNTVFVPVQDGNLYKVDRSSGKIGGKINTGKIIGSSRIVRGGRLYLANYQGEVICYNHELDAVQWRYNTERKVAIATLLDADSLFVVNAGGTVYSLALDGSLRWKTELGSSIKSDPVIRGGNMIAVTERVLYVIDKISGNVRWSYVMENFPATGFAVSERNLFIGTENKGIIVLRKE